MQQPEVIKKDNFQTLPVSPNPTTAPLASNQAKSNTKQRPVAVITPKQPIVVSKRAPSAAPAAVKQGNLRRNK